MGILPDDPGGMASVSAESPCPICGRPDMCRIARNRRTAVCSRVEGLTRLGDAGWLHQLAERGESRSPTSDTPPPERPPPARCAAAPFSDTDVANGRRFAADHGADVRFVADWDQWLVYDGRRWVPDRSETGVEARAKWTTDRMAQEAAARAAEVAHALAVEADPTEQAKLGVRNRQAQADLKHAKRTADVRALRRMLRAARSEPALLVPEGSKVFDVRPDLLNCPNGTVELRTGRLRGHRREDHLTRLCPTRFEPAAPRAGYHEFLARVFDGRPAVAAYVRAFLGYAITGEVSDQSLHIFSGDGSNGKGVLVTLATGVLGEGQYVHTAPADLLLADGRGDRHPTEKTGLRGARLVVCSETDEDRYIDEAKMKALTGGDTVTARFMRGDFFQFAPTHKLVLLTNYRPRVRGTDHGVWRRMRLVPFEARFWKEADRALDPGGDYPERFRADPDLAARLARDEAEGILADMVEHAARFYRDGLRPPPEVTGATAEYRADQDIFGQFFAARVREDERGPGVKATDLYTAFVRWWEAEGHGTRPPSGTKFGVQAKRKFRHSTPKGVVYHVRLLAGDVPAAPEGSGGSEAFAGQRRSVRARVSADT